MMRQLFGFLLVLAAAAFLYTYIELAEQPAKPNADAELVPDFVAYQLTRRNYDQQGHLNGEVVAVQMAHFEQLGQMQFEQPAYTLYENGLPRWQISSVQGVFYQDNKVILEQQVRLNNLFPDEMFKQIQTEQLELAVDTQLLKTELPVVVIGQNFIINGSGLQADLIKQKLRLFKHQGTVYHHEKN